MSDAVLTDTEPLVSARETDRLATKDKVIIGMLVFFMAIAGTLELYWILHRGSMLEQHDVFARLLALYWPADRTYRDPWLDNAQAFTLSLETINTFVSQWLGLAVIYGIVKRRPWRHWLQLTLATYTAYGTVLYFYVAHLADYNVMAGKTLGIFLLFYVCNLPWLIGYGYMMLDSIRAIHRRFV